MRSLWGVQDPGDSKHPGKVETEIDRRRLTRQGINPTTETDKNERPINWYMRNGYDGVLKVACTPNGDLSKRIKTPIRNKVPGKRILIQELLGPRLKSKIASPWEPWRPDSCGCQECKVCLQEVDRGFKRGIFWERSATFTIQCKPCELQRVCTRYVGETKLKNTGLSVGGKIFRVVCIRVS